jgi:PAS domain S-box-containing protein
MPGKSEHRPAEQALLESEARTRAILDTAVDAIITIDERGTIESINPATERLFGYSAAELVSQNVKILMPQPYRDEHDRYVQNYLDTDQKKIIGIGREVVGQRKDGTTFPMHLAVSELRLGSRCMFTAIIRDISDLKRAAEQLRFHVAELEERNIELMHGNRERARLIEELQERTRTLKEADRRKDEFLAMLAHELRNPLAPIYNAVRVMRLLGPEDGNMQWARDVIERQVQHMSRLVDDLLDVSRITRGKITLRKEIVEVVTLIACAVEMSRPFIDTRHHELTVSMPPEPLCVTGDPTRLAQVLGNLLNNAAKFTEEGGKIRLTVVREDEDVVITVSDTGIGIPPELLPQVFDLFTQGQQLLDRSQGGLGIGLTLVRELAEMHGGSVHARSAGLRQGSEFMVRLPLVTPNRSERGADSTPRLGMLPPQRSRAATCRVLVVDDNVDAAQSLALCLQVMGYEVQARHDGPAALEAAETFRPRIVLLDIGLPGMNGYEVARCLRQRVSDHLALIAMTGFGQQRDRRRAQQAGFDRYVVKPVDPEALEKLLAQFAAGN